jgi:hypothetical protein
MGWLTKALLSSLSECEQMVYLLFILVGIPITVLSLADLKMALSISLIIFSTE